MKMISEITIQCHHGQITASVLHFVVPGTGGALIVHPEPDLSEDGKVEWNDRWVLAHRGSGLHMLDSNSPQKCVGIGIVLWQTLSPSEQEEVAAMTIPVNSTQDDATALGKKFPSKFRHMVRTIRSIID